MGPFKVGDVSGIMEKRACGGAHIEGGGRKFLMLKGGK